MSLKLKQGQGLVPKKELFCQQGGVAEIQLYMHDSSSLKRTPFCSPLLSHHVCCLWTSVSCWTSPKTQLLSQYPRCNTRNGWTNLGPTSYSPSRVCWLRPHARRPLVIECRAPFRWSASSALRPLATTPMAGCSCPRWARPLKRTGRPCEVRHLGGRSARRLRSPDPGSSTAASFSSRRRSSAISTSTGVPV